MSESSVICEICHERAATHHLCEPHLQRSRELCKECFDALRLPGMETWDRQYQEALKTGKCRFCGGPAVAGCGGSIPILGEQYQFWCEDCRKDLAEYSRTRRDEPRPEFSVTESGLQRTQAWLAEEERKLQEYMQAKIGERQKN
jgi:hypothetical protein